MVDHKKVVGILTEMSAETDRVKFVVIGIGVNVQAAAAQLPAHAVSLKNETDHNFTRVELVQEILRMMEDWYLRFQKEGFSNVLKRWKELSMTLGKHVRVSDFSQTVEESD